MVQTTLISDQKKTNIHPRESLTATRQAVKDLMLQCPAFKSLPQDKQTAIAQNTVRIIDYIARPEGIPASKIAAANKGQTKSDPYAMTLASGQREGTGDFTAHGAREGAKVAGLLLREVNFVEFVSGLIDGVFNSIVTSSIKQMEAYGQLVADVAKTLNDFRDENVTDNQGRDHLVDKFPDLFQLDIDTGDDGESRPRVRLKEEVDESDALKRVNSQMPTGEAPMDSLDLDDDETEQKLVQTARTQLASSRQQLLATMVLMGINRIVVTSGKISAKVNYRFQAMDTFQKSATKFDYEQFGTQYTSEGEMEKDDQRSSSWEKGQGSMDARRYTQAKWKNSAQPFVKITNIEASQTDAQLQASAQLAGEVNVNFKSETLPLERMADSFQISQIQQASQRNRSDAKPAT